MLDIVGNPIYQQLQNVTLTKGTSATREPHCPICLIEFEDEDHLLMDETCGMSFHADCLLEWLTQKSSCPRCRQCLRAHNNAVTQLPNEATSAVSRATRGMMHHLENPLFEEFIDHLNHDLREDTDIDNPEGDDWAVWADTLRLLFSCLGDAEHRYLLEGLLPFLELVLHMDNEVGDHAAVLAEMSELLSADDEDEEQP